MMQMVDKELNKKLFDAVVLSAIINSAITVLILMYYHISMAGA